MSATGIAKANGDKTERAQLDYYRTPAYAVDAILPHLQPAPRRDGAPRWLDPGCGDGAIAERLLAWWPKSEGVGIEIDPDRASVARKLRMVVYQDDFLRQGAIWESRVDLVIGNPPFKQALEFARRGLELLDLGELALLLRAGFLEAKRGSERDEFLQAHPPDVFLLAKRPRFTGDGGDSATYVWCVWGPGRGERFVRLRSPGNEREAIQTTQAPLWADS